MRRKCFSVSSQAEATQRSTMAESRQRLTLWVRRRTPLWGLSMRLVVARHLWSDAGILQPLQGEHVFDPLPQAARRRFVVVLQIPCQLLQPLFAFFGGVYFSGGTHQVTGLLLLFLR
jgi:hypothetical protein